MNPFYLVLETGVVVFFIAAAWLALRRGRLPFLELISAATFGILLEEGDQLIFETYHYSADWVLVLDRAPIVIGLSWALIIAGAMRITDALGVRRRYAPFVDSVLAIMLDLAFDAVAIRMGLWTWREIGFDQGWFGVPAGNFYAWLFVTLGFSLLSRWLRDASRHRPVLEWLQLAVPGPAFLILLLGLVPFSLLLPVVDPAPGGGLGMFLVTLGAFCALGAYGIWGPDRPAGNGERAAMIDLHAAFGTRLAIHLVFLAALFWLGLATSQPVLLLVSLVMLALEWPLARLAHARSAAGRSGRILGDT
ncbi:MAG TPA: carotenoid biosynthesis protein [Candidatus Limnocylindria bacterium]|nr:carotenoid biosynthesis protein [Candidatus Limnocylindria bacterium]